MVSLSVNSYGVLCFGIGLAFVVGFVAGVLVFDAITTQARRK